MQYFKSWLSAALHNVGKTQKDLANFLGVREAAITEIKEGTRKISGKEAGMMATFLRVSTEEVIDRSNPSKSPGLKEEWPSYVAASFPKPPPEPTAFNTRLYQQVHAAAMGILAEKNNLDAEEVFNFIKRLYEVAIKRGAPPSRETVEWLFEDTFNTKIF